MCNSKFKNIPTHIVLCIAAFITIFPFYWMIATSFKDDNTMANLQLFPNPVDLSHYPYVLSNSGILRGLLNSTTITLLAVVGTVFSSAMAAYAFSKIQFKGKGMIFGALLGTMMIPFMVTLIPQYILFSKIGWVNTFLPLIVPGCFINAYGVFLLRSFMVSLPDSYIESAKLDGCNQLKIFLRIILPLCKPALLALSLISFINVWNNFLGQLIYLNDEKLFTVTLAINTFKDAYTLQYGNMMAASTISILPIMIMYFFAQRFIIEGVALSGVKA
jgi:multiple sugar transport system permease protein